MSRKNKDFTRREFIKQLGLAAGVGIPFLRSAVALGQTTTAPLRVMFVALQHGWGFDRSYGTITGTSTNFTLPRPLDVFNSIKNQSVFIDGLRTGYWGNAHDVSYSDILTCSVPALQESSTQLGVHFPMPTSASLDWRIGNQHNKGVLRFSNGYRSWGRNYHALSFDNSLRELPFYTTAREAYMSVIDPLRQQDTSDPALAAGNNALFSFLGDDARRLQARLSGDERVKLDGYLEALNALGNRILNPGTSAGSNIVLPPLPGLNLSFNDQTDQFLEMIKIAFTLDTHRVAVLGLGQGVTDWTWTDTAGVNRAGNTFGSDFHHEIAHYASSDATSADRRRAYEGWVRWYGQKIVGFVNQLAAVTDVDGRSLLDNTVIVLLGEVGNGGHDRRDIVMPVIGGGSRIQRGRWLQTPKVDPDNRQGVFLGSRDITGALHTNSVNYGDPFSRHHLADLWVTIARMAGLNINTFGIDVQNYQPIAL